MDLDLSQYQVSLITGFLPEHSPLPRLSNPIYAPWEDIANQLPALISASQVRTSVHALPVISCDGLVTFEEFRRAYSILSLLANAYIWNGELPSDVLPPCITVPLLAVSDKLQAKPLITYSSIVLWNFRVRPDPRPTHLATEIWSDPDNVEALNMLSGTDDENWFVAVMVAIEAQGGGCILLLLQIISAMSLEDDSSLVIYLDQLQLRLHHMRETLLRLYEGCSPEVFYLQIRPYHAGCGGPSSKELPKGVRYIKELSELHDTTYCQFIGGSGAQSALPQCFDIVLGVIHLDSTPKSATRVSAGKGRISTSKDDGGFQAHMREYMPGPHRRFLEKLSEYQTVREYVTARPEKYHLVAAFNCALKSLRAFRSAHIQIATRYIIIPSRSIEHASLQKGTVASQSMGGSQKEAVLGTGGTSFLPLLRGMRDETIGVCIH